MTLSEYPEEWLEVWIERLKKEEIQFHNELMVIRHH